MGLFFLGVLLRAIIDILGREDLDGSAKGLWVLVVLIFPVVGAVVYLLGMAPKAQRPAAPPPKTFTQKHAPSPTARLTHYWCRRQGSNLHLLA